MNLPVQSTLSEWFTPSEKRISKLFLSSFWHKCVYELGKQKSEEIKVGEGKNTFINIYNVLCWRLIELSFWGCDI